MHTCMIEVHDCLLLPLGSDLMERKKAQHQSTNVPRKGKDVHTKKIAIHTSMKIEAQSSRERNIALAVQVGIKASYEVS